jgi:hypothetical protein
MNLNNDNYMRCGSGLYQEKFHDATGEKDLLKLVSHLFLMLNGIRFSRLSWQED